MSEQTPPTGPAASSRQQSRVPVAVALILIGAVWVGACAISFMEQVRLARMFEFELDWLFPLIFDGLASALAVTAWSAALDGRHSPLLRGVTAVAVTGSAWVNAAAVMERTPENDPTQIGMAVAVPIAAWIAFELLLSELRRQIMRARGVPAPASVPALRPVRVLLAPARALREWRTLTLEVTDPRRELPRSGGPEGDRRPSATAEPPATPAEVTPADDPTPTLEATPAPMTPALMISAPATPADDRDPTPPDGGVSGGVTPPEAAPDPAPALIPSGADLAALPSDAARVRAALSDLGIDATPLQVAGWLSARGVEISPAYIKTSIQRARRAHKQDQPPAHVVQFARRAGGS